MPTRKAPRPARSRGRPARDSAVSEREICDAAVNVFAAKGYNAATLKEIAELAGVDPSLISYQFGSKLDLWKAVIIDLGQRLRGGFPAIALSAGDCVETSLRRGLEGIVRFMLDNPQIPHFMARDIYRDSERAEWVNDKLALPLRDYLRAPLASLQAAGKLRPGPPDMLILHFSFSMAFSIIRRERLIAGSPELADDEVFRTELIRMLVGSVLRDG